MADVADLRLGVNVDHVATLRNARGGHHPDPVRAAHLAMAAGANGITAHLREDRRHINDDDIARLKADVAAPLNLEMAATDEMLEVALKTKPHAACLVPERRAERTTDRARAPRERPVAVARLDGGPEVSLCRLSTSLPGGSLGDVRRLDVAGHRQWVGEHALTVWAAKNS